MASKLGLIRILLVLYCVSQIHSYYVVSNGHSELQCFEESHSGHRESLQKNKPLSVICLKSNFEFKNLWSYHKINIEFEDISKFQITKQNKNETLFAIENPEQFKKDSWFSQNEFFKHTIKQETIISSTFQYVFPSKTPESIKELHLYIPPYDNFLEDLFTPSDRIYIGFIDDGPRTLKSVTYTFESAIKYHLTILIISLLLFTKARTLSESILVYYLIWILTGMILFLILLVFIAIYLVKDRIGIPNVIAISSLFFIGSFLVFRQYFEPFLICYMTLGGLFGAIMAYRYSKTRSNYTLTRLAGKFIATIGFFFSFESILFSLGFTSIILLLQFRIVRKLLNPLFYPIYWLKWKLFPSRRKLISPGEYKSQGVTYTRKGVEELIQQIRDDPSVLTTLSEIGRERAAMLLQTGDHLSVVLNSTKMNSPSNYKSPSSY